MPSSPGGIRVNPNGQTAVVTFTLPNGGTPVAYSSRSGAGTIALPATVSAETTFWFQEQTTLTVSALVGTQQSATSAGTTATVDLSGGGVAGLTVAVIVQSGGSSVASLVPTAVKTANYTAAVSDYVPVDTTSGNVTVTLPTAPADKAQIGIKHVVRGGTNTVTFVCGGSDVLNKTGGSTSGTITLLNQSAVLQYKASTGIWYVVGGDLPLSQLDTRYGGTSLPTQTGKAGYDLTTNGSTSAWVRSELWLDAFGGDPTGATDSTSAFTAALAALPSITLNNGTTSASYKVGTIRLSATAANSGYKIGSTADIGNLGPFISIVGPGKQSCFVYYYGSGTALRRTRTVVPADTTWDDYFSQGTPQGLGGKYDGFTLDGSNAGAGAYGISDGDFEGAIITGDVMIQHFNGAGSVGLAIKSVGSWYENAQHQGVNVYDCSTCVLMDGAQGQSIAYCDLEYKIYVFPNQHGVVITNGALPYNGSLKIRGNSGHGASNTGRILEISGSNGGLYTNLDSMHVDIHMESNALHGNPGSVRHQTIYFGTVGSNKFKSCYGLMNFANGYQPSNWTQAAGRNLGFTGQIIGDGNLNPVTLSVANPIWSVVGPDLRRPGYYDTGSNTLDLTSGDYFDLGDITVDTTISFTAASGVGNAARRILVRARQAGSQFKNITWPSGILWEDGVVPLLSPAQGSVDFWDLWTPDSATWYGRQRPRVATATTLPNLVTASRNIGNAGAGTTRNFAPAATMTSGNTVFMAVADLVPGSSAGTPTITDTNSNVWTLDATAGSTGPKIWIYRARLNANLTTGQNVTVTFGSSTTFVGWLFEASGLGSSPAIDIVSTTDTGSTSASSISLPSLATRGHNELMLSFAACGNSGVSDPTWTAGPGEWNQWFGVAKGFQMAYTRKNQASPYGKPTWTPSSSQTLAAVVCSYHA